MATPFYPANNRRTGAIDQVWSMPLRHPFYRPDRARHLRRNAPLAPTKLTANSAKPEGTLPNLDL